MEITHTEMAPLNTARQKRVRSLGGHQESFFINGLQDHLGEDVRNQVQSAMEDFEARERERERALAKGEGARGAVPPARATPGLGA